MLRYWLRGWWHRRQRLALLLVGAAVLSAGLTFLVGIGQASRLTVQQTLEERWRSSYDILVRPADAVGPLEDSFGIMEADQTSNYPGGISLEQWQAVKSVDDVDVAAPVAILGWVVLPVDGGRKPEIEDSRVYRETTRVETGTPPFQYPVPGGSSYFMRMNQSAVDRLAETQQYPELQALDQQGVRFVAAPLLPPGQGQLWGYPRGVPIWPTPTIYQQPVLLGAVDPDEEARLVGLDKSVVEGRYFTPADGPQNHEYLSKSWDIPVIAAEKPFAPVTLQYRLEQVNLPDESPDNLVKQIREKGGQPYLDQTPDKTVFSLDVSPRQMQALLRKQLLEREGGKFYTRGVYLTPGPVEYRKVPSPYPNRWPLALEAVPQQMQYPADWTVMGQRVVGVPEAPVFRQLEGRGSWLEKDGTIYLRTVGFYDPQKLKMAKDPLAEMPMEQYRPATATVVLGEDGRPLNPAPTLGPSGSPWEVITSPPLLWTTIEAAAAIGGDQPISAIRVRVTGTEHLDAASQRRAEQVAAEITRRTGLRADVTLGSSPHRVLVHASGIGYLEELWIHLNAAMTMVRETGMAFWLFIAAVLMEGLLFVLATSIVSILSRRSEFALLEALGWPAESVRRLVLLDGTATGMAVGLVGMGVSVLLGRALGRPVEPLRLVLVLLLSLVAYGGGTALALLIRRDQPLSAYLRAGEVQATGGRRYARWPRLNLVLQGILRRPWRAWLSLAAASVPAFMLALLLHISLRLKGVMHLAWAGEYISLEVQPLHYLAGVIALALAVVSIADLISLNVTDRRSELALLSALGWRPGWIRLLVLTEGAVYGLAAGIIGLAGAWVLLALVYGGMADFGWSAAAVILGLSTLVGAVGAAGPAEAAVRSVSVAGLQA